MCMSRSTCRIAASAALALLVLPASGTSGTPGTQAMQAARAATRAAPLTVVDDHHSRVTLPGPAHRIVALAPNVVEILYAIGMGGRVVGISQDTDYPAAATHKPVVLSYSGGANLEKIVALRPDLLMAAGIDAAYLPKLRSLHLPLVVLDPTTIDGILHDVTLAGTATGANGAASVLLAKLHARIDGVTRRIMHHAISRPRVYYEYDYGKTGGYTYGLHSFGDTLITMAGGENIGKIGRGPYPLLSPEQIIGNNPQVIVLGDAAFGVSPAGVAQRAGFSTILAVQRHNVFPFNDTLVSRPGPRIVDGLEALARLLHPEAFH